LRWGPNIRYVRGAYWDFWDHYLPLAELSQSEGLRNRGFAIHHLLAPVPAIHNGGRSGVSPDALRIYLKIPVWRMFGHQFLIVAKSGPAELLRVAGSNRGDVGPTPEKSGPAWPGPQSGAVKVRHGSVSPSSPRKSGIHAKLATSLRVSVSQAITRARLLRLYVFASLSSVEVASSRSNPVSLIENEPPGETRSAARLGGVSTAWSVCAEP
jgi:hypothetical protein